MTASECESLDKAGYIVVENILDPPSLEQVRARVEELYESEGENAGSEFRKFKLSSFNARSANPFGEFGRKWLSQMNI
jgi:ectoine hydroxylase-related dioxygenase (phytanoyl-CoA dioxygenase family)